MCVCAYVLMYLPPYVVFNFLQYKVIYNQSSLWSHDICTVLGIVGGNLCLFAKINNFGKYFYYILFPFLNFIPTGIIKTALLNMDRENREQYQVVIQAKDMETTQMGGLSGTTTVNITLTDVNDNPPRFPQSRNI